MGHNTICIWACNHSPTTTAGEGLCVRFRLPKGNHACSLDFEGFAGEQTIQNTEKGMKKVSCEL